MKISGRTNLLTFIFVTLLILIFLSVIFSCTSKEHRLHFVLCPKSFSNPYWFEAEQGMRDAALALNIKAEFLGPAQADVAAQVNILESLITKQVDGIAVSPDDPNGIKSVIDRAIDSGIPVLTFDSDSPQSKRICYIGTDNYQAGREAAKQMIKYLGNEGKYAIMTGGLGALNLNERIRGFRDELKEQSANLEEITLLACNEDTDKALLQMEDFTRSNQELNAWFVTGCWATVTPKGAFLNALNRRTDMVIIGFDTVKEELLLVKEGVVQALIGQRPYQMGKQCIETLYDIVVYKKMPEKEIYDTGVDVVTKENVDQFLKKY